MSNNLKEDLIRSRLFEGSNAISYKIEVNNEEYLPSILKNTKNHIKQK